MKKIALILAVALALPVAALAQATKDGAKPAATKPTVRQKVKTKAKAVTQKVVPRRVIKAVEGATPVSDDPNFTLSEADLAVASKVHTGKIQCELGADVTVTADDKKPGFFNVSAKNVRYRMHPVESRTGAVRLEDPKAGTMWLQIANKSMLMNQKQGLRLADDCKAPAQVAVADEMLKHPPKSLFEGADAPR